MEKNTCTDTLATVVEKLCVVIDVLYNDNQFMALGYYFLMEDHSKLHNPLSKSTVFS